MCVVVAGVGAAVCVEVAVSRCCSACSCRLLRRRLFWCVMRVFWFMLAGIVSMVSVVGLVAVAAAVVVSVVDAAVVVLPVVVATRVHGEKDRECRLV